MDNLKTIYVNDKTWKPIAEKYLSTGLHHTLFLLFISVNRIFLMWRSESRSMQQVLNDRLAFGGIAGLFLGCSLLSGVEIIYYVIIMTFILLKKCKKHFDKFVEINSREYHTHRVQNTNRNPKNFRRKVDNVQVHSIKVISLSDVDKNVKEDVKSDTKKTRY